MIIFEKAARCKTASNSKSIGSWQLRYNDYVNAAVTEVRKRIPRFRSHLESGHWGKRA
jgi:hypothetical protein